MTILKPAFLIQLVIFMGMAGFVYGQNRVPRIQNEAEDPSPYCGDSVQVAPFISIRDVQINEPGEGMKVSVYPYEQGQDKLVYEKVGSFQYRWDNAKGVLEISGAGSDQEYETAIKKIWYKNLGTTPKTGIRSFAITLLDADYLAHTGHFYRFIASRGIRWTEAKVQAANMVYYGLKGYLATITSDTENGFIYSKIDGVGWIGASDQKQQGKWIWETGPEAGTQFWDGVANGGYTLPGQYSNWNYGEPNNLRKSWGDYENYAHMVVAPDSKPKSWNDLSDEGDKNAPDGYYYPQGFVVEYGGMKGDSTVNLSATSYVDVRDNNIPKLDYSQVDTFFCGPTSQVFNIAFTNSHPDILLSPLDSRVTIDDGDTYNPTITVPEYGAFSFQLNMIAESGCEYTDTIRVGFHNQPEARFELDETSCKGYNLQLAFEGTTVEKANFTWYYNGEVYASETDLKEIEIPLGFRIMDRSVALKVNEQGCADKSPVKQVLNEPVNTVMVDDSVGCSPHSTILVATALETGQSYSWNFGDGNSSHEQKPLHTFINSSDTVRGFDVDLTVVSATGCRNFELMKDLISAYPVPTAAFDPVPEVVVITSPGISFYNNSHAASSYLWDFGDSTAFSEEVNPSHKYNEIGDFNVRLEVTNDFGCSDTLLRIVGVDFDRFFPPNAFSPNAAKEEDREFRIYGKGIIEEGYKLIVYNRWGETIFESGSSSHGWNGKMSNGEDAPAGVYTWVLQYVDVKSKKHTQQGNVTLLY